MAKKISDNETEIFSAIPWCRKILDDEEFAVEPTLTRTGAADSSLNRLLSHTLKTNDTIEGWCSLYRVPNTSKRNCKDETRTLLSLKPGLDGYTNVCHGGVTATILDEVMSILVCVCRLSQGLSPENLTADLRIHFIKPVTTPGIVLVTAKVRDIQKGRKYFLDAEMVDQNNVVLAKGSGLFLHVPPEKL